MKKVIADVSGANFIGELHYVIREAFLSSGVGFPDFYGDNLDALRDCLTGFIETPVEIVLIGLDSLNGEVLEYAEKIAAVFSEAAQEKQGITAICENK